jgi:NitT/TauT family transport system permease protein
MASTYEEVVARKVATRAVPRKRRRITWWQPVVVFFVLIGLWYLVSLFYASQQLAFLVPYPHLVFQAMFLDPIVRPAIIQALARSTGVALTGLGFAIVIGVVWAILMAQAKWVERSLYPYAVILQCIPILALVPLIGALFGYEFNSRVIVTVMISVFPMVSNTLFGLQSVDKGQRELFQLQGANNWTTLTKLQVPAALPSIFVGLRTAAGLSVIGAIVGDQFFQRGAPGLGVLIQVYASRLQGSALFATIITASLLGVAVFLIFGLIGRLAVGRWYDFS